MEKAARRRLGAAGMILGFALGLGGWAYTAADSNRNPRLAGGLYVLALVLGCVSVLVVAWPQVRRVRLRSPIYLANTGRPTVDPKEQERMDTVRRMKRDLLAFFHAWANPAMQAALRLARDIKGAMENRDMSWKACAHFFAISILKEAEDAEDDLRKVLEGLFWNEEGMEAVRRRQLEEDIRKQKPDDLGFALLLYTMDYRILHQWSQELAKALDLNLATDPVFQEWSKKNERYEEHMQELLGESDLADYREVIGEQLADV